MKNASKGRFWTAVSPILILLGLASWTVAGQTEVYLNISKQVNPKIKVLVPPFREQVPHPETGASSLRKTMLKDLELSGLITPLHEGEFLAEAQKSDLAADRILFANCARFGAEVLLKVEDFSTQSQRDFQATAYSLRDQNRLMAKRYKAPVAGQKKLVHTMANDLVRTLTGLEGIALSKIAFVSEATGYKELYLMDYDGDNVRRLSTDRSLFLYPRWSPDTRDLVAVSYLRGKPYLCRIRVAQGSRSFLSTFPGLNSGGSYSPDGRSLALTLSKDGNPEIYRLDLVDGSAHRLTRDSFLDSSPTWSPEGSRIAFVSNRSGSPQIYEMNADGTKQHRISLQGGYNTSPAWSPKGDFIAYCTLIGKNFQLYLLDTSSGTTYQITNDDRSNEDPAWAPDGRHLVYSSSKNYRSDIFMIDIYDQHPVQLTRHLGSCVSPSWSRNFSN